MVVAVAFVVALAILAGAVLLIKRIVRNKDVISGGYVDDDEDWWSHAPRAVAAPARRSHAGFHPSREIASLPSPTRIFATNQLKHINKM
jgi:hypothetical protein